tara:strand:+ start:10974 stop:13121 length:2148 start_codon:yes stop_codon:yes gene_type:complete
MRVLVIIVAAIVALFSGAASAQQVALSAPASAPMNSFVDVQWTGPDDSGDYIGIGNKDGKPIPYSGYFYTGNSDGGGQLRLPERAGTYTIVYVSKAAGPLHAIPITAEPVSATLEAPTSVAANSDFEVRWSGPNLEGDRITIGTATGRAIPYQSRAYTNGAGPVVTMHAPEKPGDFTVVYLTGKTVIGSVPFTSARLDATLAAPAAVPANDAFTLNWTGPDNPGDKIQIGDANGRPIPYSSYGYTGQNPGTMELNTPEKPGAYSITYITGSTVVAYVPLTVTALSASIEAPATVPAGTPFTIRWSGPNNANDRIRVHDADGKWIPYASSAYTELNPGEAQLIAPEELGPYTIAYVTGDSVVTKTPFTVVEVTASLMADDEVSAGLSFPVTWEGPGNLRDVIVLVGDDPLFPLARGYVASSEDNVVTLDAPNLNGLLELRYMTPGGKQLAQRPIRIVAPPEEPGRLVVLPVTRLTSLSALEVILDASGSMLQRQDGRRRIDIAKETLATLLQQTIPDGTPFALRVFGNHEADSCRTDLEVPLAPLDTVSVLRLIDSLQAVNLARTAIGRSLELVESDLSEADGEHLIILITDGEETCEGDPAAAIATLRAKGIDARVNIVGYAIEDTELEATFADWAELGGGSYFAAGDGDQLAAALLAAAQPSFTVSDADGVVVTRGFAGSEPIILPSGTYEVRSSATSVRAVVRPDKETAVALD